MLSSQRLWPNSCKICVAFIVHLKSLSRNQRPATAPFLRGPSFWPRARTIPAWSAAGGKHSRHYTTDACGPSGIHTRRAPETQTYCGMRIQPLTLTGTLTLRDWHDLLRLTTRIPVCHRPVRLAGPGFAQNIEVPSLFPDLNRPTAACNQVVRLGGPMGPRLRLRTFWLAVPGRLGERKRANGELRSRTPALSGRRGRLPLPCPSTAGWSPAFDLTCQGKQIVLIIIREVTFVVEEKHPVISVL